MDPRLKPFYQRKQQIDRKLRYALRRAYLGELEALRDVAEAYQEHLTTIVEIMKLPKNVPVPKCYRCQGGRSTYLCAVCAHMVRSVYRDQNRLKR